VVNLKLSLKKKDLLGASDPDVGDN